MPEPTDRETRPSGSPAASESDQNQGEAEGGEHAAPRPPEEIGGPAGPEPTRFGDWERKGRCIDF